MITNANAEKNQVSRHTGSQKAAVLMVTLGEQVSSEVLKHLDEDEVAMIGKEVARIAAITSEDAETILEEFYTMSMAQLAANDENRARAEQEMLASLQLPPNTKKTEVLRRQIGDSAKRDPQATAQLLRSWLNEQER